MSYILDFLFLENIANGIKEILVSFIKYKTKSIYIDNTNETNYSKCSDGLGVIDPVLPEGMESSYNVYYSLAAFFTQRLYAGISALDIFSTSSDLNILSNEADGFTIISLVNIILW